ILSATFGTIIDGLGRLAGLIGAIEAALTTKTWKTQTASKLAKPRGVSTSSPLQSVTLAERSRWMQRREVHLAHIERDPARAVPSDAHADVAIFEEWLDNRLTDEFVERYMRAHSECEQCRAVYERYKDLRATSLLQR